MGKTFRNKPDEYGRQKSKKKQHKPRTPHFTDASDEKYKNWKTSDFSEALRETEAK